MTVNIFESPSLWAKHNFLGVKLGEKRRENRLLTLAEAYARQPGKSLPKLFPHRYDVKAAYKFFACKEVTPERIQATHMKNVKHEMNQSGSFLLIEDGSELIWNNSPRSGLGLTSGGRESEGFILQSVLAVKWPKEGLRQRGPVEVLGLCSQQCHPRKRAPKGENSVTRKSRKRESMLWEQSNQNIGQPNDPLKSHWIRVCDRGADIYEFIQSCLHYEHKFVIRAAQNRCLVDPLTQKKSSKKLFETLRETPAMGSFELELKNSKPKRIAHLKVSFKQVLIHAPKSSPNKEAFSCSAVRVWEDSPPEGVEPLEWILLCSERIESFDTALNCIAQYATRWLIEEFHKCLKTGLGAEKLQLETAQRLFNAVSLLSIVALRLVSVKEQGRLYPQAAAEESGLSELELKLLRGHLKRPIKTMKELILAIGRLGGHLNRKSDGMPGWQSLWSGMKDLILMAQGAQLLLELEPSESAIMVHFPIIKRQEDVA